MIRLRGWLIAVIPMLWSCATYTTQAPKLLTVPIDVRGITLVNETPQGGPRVYFTDGITTYNTDFHAWTQVLINRYGSTLATSRTADTPPRSLTFSIQSITCSGHFLASCTVTVFVVRSDGVKRLYSTDSYSGLFAIDIALNRALDSAVELALADGSLNQFVGRREPAS